VGVSVEGGQGKEHIIYKYMHTLKNNIMKPTKNCLKGKRRGKSNRGSEFDQSTYVYAYETITMTLHS
jgi:hypothetical protein